MTTPTKLQEEIACYEANLAVRACLLLGLDAIERDPTVLLGLKGRKAPKR